MDHDIFFEALMKRGLPLAIIRFLLSWYKTQSMRVHWKSFLSEPFCVSNSVRHASVLLPFLYAVYLDGLLAEWSKSGVGCHWGSSFAGAFSYADDVVLLAPCASALRTMINICSSFAVSHKLEFNSMKTKLMCFHCPSVHPITADIYLNNIKLSFVSMSNTLVIFYQVT